MLIPSTAAVVIVYFQKYSEADGDDKSSDLGSDIVMPTAGLPFQALLTSFLDNKAPVLGEYT